MLGLRTSVSGVRTETTRLESLNRTSLDICFCFDATGSMASLIEQVKTDIVKAAQDIAATEGMDARFGLVVYRDYSDGAGRLQSWKFQSAGELATTLSTVAAYGGGDGPEDCFGGLWAASQVTWEAPCRIIVWIGDAPQHGLRYNNGEGGDDYPNGDPEGRTSAAIFAELQRKQIRLLFCKLIDYTDKMIEVLLQEAVPYGVNLLLSSTVSGDMRTFLHNTLKTILAETTVIVTLGPKKEYIQVPATFEVDSKWKSAEEKASVTALTPYQIKRISTLSDLFSGRNPFSEERPRAITLKTTLSPADSGELRIVYYALIDDVNYVMKESKFEGAYNGKKALLDQACIQAVALSLANEFTIRLSVSITPVTVEYVPVELLQLHGRPAGRDWFSLERFIEGDFKKFTNNNGRVDMGLETMHPAITAFSHFTYCYTEGVLMVTDLQGVAGVAAPNCVYTLTDPAIHTSDPDNYLPDPTNKGESGMTAFFQTHTCNSICQTLRLKRPEEMKNREIIEEVEEEEDEVYQPQLEICHPVRADAMQYQSYPMLQTNQIAIPTLYQTNPQYEYELQGMQPISMKPEMPAAVPSKSWFSWPCGGSSTVNDFPQSPPGEFVSMEGATPAGSSCTCIVS